MYSLNFQVLHGVWDQRLVNRTWISFLSSVFFWRQLTFPPNKLMTNDVLFLLHLMKLVNWQILQKQQVPPLFILPRGSSQIWSSFTGRHGEIEKYRESVGSGIVWTDIHYPSLLFTPAASDEKPRRFVYHWRPWHFLCAIFFPSSIFGKLGVRESPLGKRSGLEGLLTWLQAFLLPSLARWEKKIVNVGALKI